MLKKITSSLALSAALVVSAEATESVKMISWWGYFDEPVNMPALEEHCNASISIDDYFTNGEFVRRSQQNQYDILIYSETASDLVNRKFENNSVDISSLADEYHPIIKEKYSSERRKSNTVFFALSGTLFLWDDNEVKLQRYDSILDILKLNKSKPFVFLDDPLEVYSILKHGLSDSEKETLGGKPLEFYGIEDYFKSEEVVFSNHFHYILKTLDFSVSYAWTGEGIKHYRRIKEKVETLQQQELLNTPTQNADASDNDKAKTNSANADYRYGFHKNFSHIAKDLITLNSNSRAARCVAESIASGRFHDEVMSSNYYMSPTLKVPANADDEYKAMLGDFNSKVTDMNWKEELNKTQYQKLDVYWQTMKLGLGK